ncbi:hypothetical protein [Porphyrobacter sp. AAP60]|uniref:hypothetical protein n=1 Tax=Porphyrobacter sp. AAP60 TaxID=1523423 RepID=UPI0006B8E0FA|nr:hypothetical protein [Porphyrobacter sp. AAP60]KPF64843.1 hypothetical protein IP79_00990 [Porphyrobacter sp. AAP60]
MKLEVKTDAQIESWARKYEEAGKTDHPDYALLVVERTKRRQEKQRLNFTKSLEHLKSCAIEGRFTSYGELAKASDVEWSKARHQMNGPRGHLDTLLDECRMTDLPLLTAICVNQENLQSGKLGEDALSGFADGARRLGIAVGDSDEFHSRCVAECFEWGRMQTK